MPTRTRARFRESNRRRHIAPRTPAFGGRQLQRRPAIARATFLPCLRDNYVAALGIPVFDELQHVQNGEPAARQALRRRSDGVALHRPACAYIYGLELDVDLVETPSAIPALAVRLPLY
jgi:hypothetical protein